MEYYIKPFEAIENTIQIPVSFRGQSDVIFGNLKDLVIKNFFFLIKIHLDWLSLSYCAIRTTA